MDVFYITNFSSQRSFNSRAGFLSDKAQLLNSIVYFIAGDIHSLQNVLFYVRSVRDRNRVKVTPSYISG